MKKVFGAMSGIFIPNITMTFGVILFLRLTIISSHVGLVALAGILVLALLVMLITSFSVASIATNMDIGSGGIYYLITRTLGIEIGGAMGFALYLAQLISTSVVITGFAFLLNAQFPHLSTVAIETSSLLLLALLAGLSSSWSLWAQMPVFFLLIAAVISVLCGSSELLKDGAFSSYYAGGELSFWQGFALFYPALTGIEAGISLSRNLRNPARSFLIGNVCSLIAAAIAYGGLAYFAHMHISIDLLKSDPFALVKFAYSSNVVVLAIYATTLASALGSLISAPRILQSIAADGVLPRVFARNYFKQKEPLPALVFTALLALIILYLTKLDQVLPIFTMMCLICYGLVNLIAAMGELMNAPSWRPTFRVPWGISLGGFFLCILLMMFVSLTWTLSALFLVFGSFLILQKRQLKAGFKDFRESVVFFFSRMTLYRLSRPAHVALTWHPQLLVLTRTPSQHMKLAHLAHRITKRSGILTFSAIVPKAQGVDPTHLDNTKSALMHFFKKEKIECLVHVHATQSAQEAYINLINTYGIGPIQPNVIVVDLADKMLTENNLIDIICACRSSGKNLVFFKDSIQNAPDLFSGSSKKNVAIWWDKSSNRSFNLTISLLSAIKEGPQWQGMSLNLYAIVSNLRAATALNSHLLKYIQQHRLSMTPAVFVENEAKDFLPFIDKYSREAELTCIALPPIKLEDDPHAYVKRLTDFCGQISNSGVCLFISCYDQIDHGETYQYPLESE